MLGRLLQPEIRSLIEQRDWRELRDIVADLSVPDLADILTDLDERDRAVVFRMLPRDRATEVFEHLEPDDQESLLEALKDSEVAQMLNDMSPDDRTALLEELPDRVVRRIMRLLAPEERRLAEALLAYPEGSVGRLMTPDYVKVKRHLTVKQCLDFVRRVGADKEMVDYIYVVDESNHLVGVVSLRELLFAPDDETVGALIPEGHEVVRIRADEDQEQAVHLLKRYDLKALPVVDSRDHLVGIVTFDDLMDVQEEEATEDIQLMSGVVPTEVSFVSAGFLDLVRSRLGALVILAFTGLFTGTILNHYQQAFSASRQFADLVPFIVVLMSASGNTASQAGTLLIRALAVERLDREETRFVLLREILMGTVIGMCLGATVGALGLVVFPDLSLHEAFVVAAALVIAITACNVLGVLVPLLFRLLGRDPAFFSNPLITTTSDFVSVTIFFEVARRTIASL